MRKKILRAFRNSYLAALLILTSAAHAQVLSPVPGPGQIVETLQAQKALMLPGDTIKSPAKNADSCRQVAKKNGVLYEYSCPLGKWVPLSGGPIPPWWEVLRSGSNGYGAVNIFNDPFPPNDEPILRVLDARPGKTARIELGAPGSGVLSISGSTRAAVAFGGGSNNEIVSTLSDLNIRVGASPVRNMMRFKIDGNLTAGDESLVYNIVDSTLQLKKLNNNPSEDSVLITDVNGVIKQRVYNSFPSLTVNNPSGSSYLQISNFNSGDSQLSLFGLPSGKARIYMTGPNNEYEYAGGLSFMSSLPIDPYVIRFESNKKIGVRQPVGTTPHSTITVHGSAAFRPIVYTGDATLTDTVHTALFDVAANAVATLPDVSTCDGRIYVIKKASAAAATITITPDASDMIENAATFVLSAQWSGITLQAVAALNAWIRVP